MAKIDLNIGLSFLVIDRPAPYRHAPARHPWLYRRLAIRQALALCRNACANRAVAVQPVQRRREPVIQFAWAGGFPPSRRADERLSAGFAVSGCSFTASYQTTRMSLI